MLEISVFPFFSRPVQALLRMDNRLDPEDRLARVDEVIHEVSDKFHLSTENLKTPQQCP